ncbi:hypothetical protein A2U01_0054024, partial [Trifolium medium]|nr:hypothetical protein [Trifolium medium]
EWTDRQHRNSPRTHHSLKRLINQWRHHHHALDQGRDIDLSKIGHFDYAASIHSHTEIYRLADDKLRKYLRETVQPPAASTSTGGYVFCETLKILMELRAAYDLMDQSGISRYEKSFSRKTKIYALAGEELRRYLR